MLILLLALLALPGKVAAQSECTAVPRSAGEPDLSGFAPLFRQAGVSFSARLGGGPVAVAVANHNDFPVTVDFGTYLEVGADSFPAGEHFLGRRCVRLSAGQTAELASPEAPEPVRAVRVRNLSITGLAVAPAEARTSPAPPAPEIESAPEEPSRSTASARADSAQFRCSEDAESAAGRACTASYLAASARAAALSGAFAGTTRECLLEYAAAQEQTAARLRRGGAAAEAAAPPEPRCFSPQSARWDFAMLRRFCPDAVWTPENRGLAACRLPSAGATIAEPPAAPTPQPAQRDVRAPTAVPAERGASLPYIGKAVGLLLRLIFGVVLSLAGLALSIPVLQAAALLLLVAPAALLRRLRRQATVE